MKHASPEGPVSRAAAAELPLWDVEPPSIPKESSERGAEQAKRFAGSQSLRILRWLIDCGAIEGKSHYVGRDGLIALMPTLTVNSATARLGPSGQLQTMKYIIAVDDTARSFAGNLVVGYAITEAGIKYAAKWRNAA